MRLIALQFELSSKPADVDVNGTSEQLENKQNSIQFNLINEKVSPDPDDPDENKYKKKKAEKISTWFSLFILIYLAVIFFFVVY